MLRQVLVLSRRQHPTTLIGRVHGCRCFTAKSRQLKRALKEEQLKGASSKSGGSSSPASAAGAASGTAATTATTPPATPTPPPPVRGGGGGGTSSGAIVPIGIVAFLALGGAYYYFSTLEEASTTTTKEVSSSSDGGGGDTAASTSSRSLAIDGASEKSTGSEGTALKSEIADTSSATKGRKAEDATTSASSSDSGGGLAAAAGTNSLVVDGGNRVISIALSDKMKNTGDDGDDLVVVPPEHPEMGNRVTTVIPQTGKSWSSQQGGGSFVDDDDGSNMADTSETLSAIEKLQQETAAQAEASIRASQKILSKSTDDTLFADLDDLNNAQLKARVAQLANELKDKTKWEAVRLKEFLSLKEKETTDKYVEAMQKQRLEFEDLLAKRLREQEYDLTMQMQRAVQEKESNIQKVIQTALDAQQQEHEQDKQAFEEIIKGELQSQLEEEYGKQLEEYKNQVAKDVQTKAQTLEQLTQKARHLETALEASQASKEGSNKAHRLSAAALALAEKLETNKSAKKELSALSLAAGNEGVIATACTNIPPSVKEGVPTVAELQARFDKVHTKCRQAALVPEGRPGLEGQLLGMAFATLKYAPHPDDPVPEGTDEHNQAEYVLVRAQNLVKNGELERAVAQLDKLEGQAAFTIEDWKKDAIDRISVEKALKVIKMECALLNESCVDE